MLVSTPTLDPISVTLAIVLLSMAASPMVLAAYLRALAPLRWANRINITNYYLFVLVSISLTAAFCYPHLHLVEPYIAVKNQIYLICIMSFTAPSVGYLIYKYEHLQYFCLRKKSANNRPAATHKRRNRTVTNQSPWAEKLEDETHRKRFSEQLTEPSVAFNVFTLGAIAVFEEIVLRAVLISSLAYLLPDLPITIMLVAVCVWFVIVHIQFGIQQAYLKLPLSVCTTVFYAIGGLIPAAIVHASFNLLTLKQTNLQLAQKLI